MVPGGTSIRRGTYVSPGVVDLPQRELGFQQALTVRDPDGHALRID